MTPVTSREDYINIKKRYGKDKMSQKHKFKFQPKFGFTLGTLAIVGLMQYIFSLHLPAIFAMTFKLSASSLLCAVWYNVAVLDYSIEKMKERYSLLFGDN